MKKDFSDGNLIRITNYTSDSDPIVGTPQIVKFSDGGYLIMWKEEKKVVTSNGVDYTASVKAVTVDSEGNLTSKIQNTKLVLSDCQPIVDKYGLVCWYVNDWTSSKLYRIDPLNISSDLIEKEVLSAPKLNSVANSASGITVKWNKVTGADFYRVYRKTSGGSWTKVVDTKDGNVTSYTDTKAAAGTTYTYTVKAFKDGVGGYYDKTGKTICRLTQPKLTSAANGASGITVKWEKVAGATGYYVYRKEGTGSWKRIASTASLSVTDTTAVAGHTYVYTVRAWSKVGSTTVLSSYNTTGSKITR